MAKSKAAQVVNELTPLCIVVTGALTAAAGALAIGSQDLIWVGGSIATGGLGMARIEQRDDLHGEQLRLDPPRDRHQSTPSGTEPTGGYPELPDAGGYATEATGETY